MKNLLQDTFQDPEVLHETVQFLHRVIKEEKFLGDLLQLLISSLKSQ